MRTTGTGPGAERRLGDFEILDEIGRGGMGVVYRARQTSMGRLVALKVLPGFVGLDPDSVARFRREAEAAGRLSHPGIVPIFHVGEDQGIHFYAMELVEGPSLESLLDSLDGRAPERLLASLFEETALVEACPGLREPLAQHSLSGGARYARSCAAIAADVAAALEVAHRGGVVHRDLKPSNILIHRSGRPVLADFGLARDEQTVGLTQSGDALGTPSYMAPEQACGSKAVDGRADVYGLGATLYELLTLRPPFDGSNPADIMRRIVTDPPVPLRQINPRVPEDLARIVHCCLEKSPDDRYPLAEALELELRAFLDGRPVATRGVSMPARVVRAVRRNRRSVLVGTLVLAATSLVFAAAGLVARSRDRAAGEAALAQAREHLEAARFDDAAAGYGRAAALLSAERVRAARRSHAYGAFERLYAEGRYQELATWLAAWPPEERDDRWHALVLRTEGRGQVAVQAAPGSRIRVRSVLDGGRLEPAWRPLAPGGVEPIGTLLVEVESPGLCRAVHRVVVERDAHVILDARGRPLDTLPAGMVLVPGDAPDADVYVAVTEVTAGEWAAALDLSDSRLAGELLPEGWARAAPPGPPEHPVRGISLQQARAFAALAGCHVPTAAEHLAAANAGVRDLLVPWGGAFDWQRVAAAPKGLSAPLPAVALPEGASVHGVLHTIGNVAELVAVPPGARPLALGGHFGSFEEQLRIGAFEALEHPDSRSPTVGLRLARFAPREDDAGAAECLDAIEREVLGSGRPGTAFEWDVGAGGRVTLTLSVAGNHGEEGSTKAFVVATPGFRHGDALAVVDGHGQPLAARGSRSPSGEATAVTVDLGRGHARGQAYRLNVRAELQPTTGLVLRGFGYELRLPMKVSGGARTAYRLLLPANCRVDAVEPEPQFRAYVGGRPVLQWDRAPSDHGDRIERIAVRFRCDGMLTGSWPVRARVRDLLVEAFDALATGDSGRLAARLAPTFVMVPSGRDRATLLLHGGARETFEVLSIEDVTAVGDVATAWLTARWTVGEPGTRVRLEGWPVRVQIDRGTRQLLSITPAGDVDRGSVEDGVYRHERLDVALRPVPGVDLRRGEGAMTELQVMCTSRAVPGAEFALYGHVAAPEETETDVLHRLTMGACTARPGRALHESEVGVVFTADGQHPAAVWEWSFGDPGGRRFDHERWRLVERGRQKLLLVERVAGPECEGSEAARRAATERFAAPEVQKFFAALRGALVLE